ncbi:MAG: hypothetical protein J6Q69_04855 [Clostridia bacterium]|nr:hypothetical protein [Clostridia bacterium]
MNEFDSPNYTEYVYDKKAEGKARFLKYLLIFGYVVFVLAFFLACYITRIIPLFAICPLVTWILIFFTWRLVSYDVYYTFAHGKMEFGKVRRRKSGNIRTPKFTLEVQRATLITSNKLAPATDEYKSAKRIYDYSSYRASEKLITIVTDVNGTRSAVVLENTPKLARLLMKYSSVAHDIDYPESV